MANFEALKIAIQTAIKNNGNREITGDLLQQILLSMVTTMGDGAINQNASDINDLKTEIQILDDKFGDGYSFAGIATPSTQPLSSTKRVFYIAFQHGEYSYFFQNGDITVEFENDGFYILYGLGEADDWGIETLFSIDSFPNVGSSGLMNGQGVMKYVEKTLSVGGLISFGKAFPEEIRNGILDFQFRTKTDYRKEMLYLTFIGIDQARNSFYVYIRNSQNQEVGIYGISNTDAGGFAGKKTLVLNNVLSTALDMDAVVVITVDFNIIGNETIHYTSGDLAYGHCPVIKPWLFNDMPEKDSEAFLPSGSVYNALSRCVGVISWGKFQNFAISNYLKSCVLEVSQEIFLGHLLVIKMVNIIAEYNNLYILIWDLTDDVQFGYYFLENASSYHGVNTVILTRASDTMQDMNSRIIATLDFDSYEIFDLGTDNTRYAPRLSPVLIEKSQMEIPYIKDIKVWVPENEKNINFGVELCGFYTQNNKFYFRLRNNTNGNSLMYGIKRYPNGIPSSGIETLSFILEYNRTTTDGFYYAEVTIDWSLYNTSYFNLTAYHVPLTVNSVLSLSVLRGTIDLESNGERFYLPQNVNLYGKNCVINMYAVTRMVLVSGCSLNDIEFVDCSSDAITQRNEYTQQEIAQHPMLQYLYRPIISISDLQNISVYMIFGHATEQIYMLKIDEGAVNARVSHCTFKYLNRPGIYDGTFNDRHTTPSHNSISGCMFVNCRTGIFAGEEFTRNYGNYFFGCIFGIVLRSANFNSVNNNFVRCDCGMYFLADNTAHGEVSTFEFAHIGVAAVYAKVIGNGLGFIFTNCQIAQGPVIAETAYALKFQSCRLDTYFIINAGAKNSIIGCNMLKNYAIGDGVTNIFNVPSDTLITLNRSMNVNESDDLYNN